MIKDRHRKVAKKVFADNCGMGKALEETGYSDSYQKSPDKLKKTQSWKELMGKYISDDLVAEKHNALLNKVGLDKQIDVPAVKSGVDMAYKLKGHYAAERQKVEHSGELELKDNDLDDASKEIVLKHQIALKKELMDNIQKKAKNEPLK